MRLINPRGALVVGVLGLIAAVVGWFVSPTLFFHAYLMAYTFWFGLAIGSLAMVMVQFLTGGFWGLATRRILEAAAATLPLLAVLFIPILLGIPTLYEWAHPEAVAADPDLQHKSVYLNVPFFVARAIVYFATWIVLAVLLNRWTAEQDRTGDPALLQRLQRFSIVGLLWLSISVSFASYDWLMSLEPKWFSTAYAPMVALGAMLLALAFAIVTVVRLAPGTLLGEISTPGVLNDLGSLLLALLMLWAYVAYFQYLIIWSGNLSDEIPWYLARLAGGWSLVASIVSVGGFLLPFCLLVFRGLKRNPRTLAYIAVWVVLTHLVDVYWVIAPAYERAGPVPTWLDVVAVIGLGGVWLTAFAWRLGKRPLLPPNDPRLAPALEAARDAGWMGRDDRPPVLERTHAG